MHIFQKNSEFKYFWQDFGYKKPEIHRFLADTNQTSSIMRNKFFTEEQEKMIVSAVKEAELNTSGEIRVHLARRCPSDAYEKGVEVFSRLKMHQTKLRNGVLFFLATEDRKFAVIGDEGIHRVVPKDFWDTIRDMMVQNFKQGKFTEGLRESILKTGDQLRLYFPYQQDDVNELPDEISED